MRPVLAVLISFLATSLPAAGWIPFTPAVRVGPAAYGQVDPAIASNGIGYLAAWVTGSPDGPMIQAQSIAADGTLEGDLPKLIDSPSGPCPMDFPCAYQAGLNVTASRDGYFIAWLAADGIHAVFTDPTGSIERRTTVPAANGRVAAAVWNGAAYLVVSDHFSEGFTVTLLDNNGMVMQSVVTAVPSPLLGLTTDASGFLMVWAVPLPDRTDMYGCRIGSSGIPGEPFYIRSTDKSVVGVAVAHDGSSDTIIWGDAGGLWMMQLEGQNASPPQRLVTDAIAAVGSAVSFNGELWIGYVLTPLDSNPRIARVSAGGAILVSLAPSGYDSIPRLATNGWAVLSVRTVRVPSLTDTDILGSLISPSGPGADFVVARSETLQQNGMIASDGQAAVAVWDEILSSNDRRIFASRFDANRTALESGGIDISGVGMGSHPAVGFNGTDYLIAWTREDGQGGAQVVARRLSRDGQVLDTADITVGDRRYERFASFDYSLRVTSDGTNWLVVWTRGFPPMPLESFRLYAARVSPTGAVVDPGGVPAVPGDELTQSDPDVSWNGSRFLITWVDSHSVFRGPTQWWVRAASITPDLAHVEFTALTPENPAPSSYFSTARVAVTASRTLIAWQTGDAPQTQHVGYQVLGSEIAPRASRRRAIGTPPPAPSIEGTIVGVLQDHEGSLSILTEEVISRPLRGVGIFATAIDARGVAAAREFQFVPDPSERLMGSPIAFGESVWMPESRFDPLVGAERLYIRKFK